MDIGVCTLDRLEYLESVDVEGVGNGKVTTDTVGDPSELVWIPITGLGFKDVPADIWEVGISVMSFLVRRNSKTFL